MMFLSFKNNSMVGLCNKHAIANAGLILTIVVSLTNGV